jgi:hypothetical protein
MGFHDNLARTAYLAGRRAADFASAAQRNANAFWFYAVAVAIVWWLAGWKWALMPTALALYCAINSVSATLIQTRLERLEASSNTPE